MQEITTTEITEISSSTATTKVVDSSSVDQEEHDKSDKSDSGKASGSGSISSATKLSTKDFQEEEGTQTDNVRSYVNVQLKAQELNTTIKSDSGTESVSKGTQAAADDRASEESPQYPSRVMVRSSQIDEALLAPPLQDAGSQVVYVPIRDQEYEAFKSWRIRTEMQRHQPLPTAFMTSQNTLYAGEEDTLDGYATLESRGRGRYGMVLNGGAPYQTMQVRRTQPVLAQPARYSGSLSGADINRREVLSRVYTDFDDDYRRRRFDDVDALGDPPLYHGNATSKIYVNGNYNDPLEQNLNIGQQNRRATLQSSRIQGIGGSYRDLYAQGGLHIGLVGQDTTQRVDLREEIRSDRHRYGAEGGYPTNGVVGNISYNGDMSLPSPPPPQAQKIRRRLSSSHKYSRYGERSELPSQVSHIKPRD